MSSFISLKHQPHLRHTLVPTLLFIFLLVTPNKPWNKTNVIINKVKQHTICIQMVKLHIYISSYKEEVNTDLKHGQVLKQV
jgi:hypothetical protein